MIVLNEINVNALLDTTNNQHYCSMLMSIDRLIKKMNNVKSINENKCCELCLQIDGVVCGGLVSLYSVDATVHDVLELVGFAWSLIQRIVLGVVLHVISQSRAYLQTKLVAY